MMLNEAEFETWAQHPVAKAIRQWLEQRVKTEQDKWASGGYNGPNMEAIAMANMGAVGRVQGYLEVLALDYQTYFGDMSEYIGFEAERSSGPGGAVRAGDQDSQRDRDPTADAGPDAGS